MEKIIVATLLNERLNMVSSFFIVITIDNFLIVQKLYKKLYNVSLVHLWNSTFVLIFVYTFKIDVNWDSSESRSLYKYRLIKLSNNRKAILLFHVFKHLLIFAHVCIWYMCECEWKPDEDIGYFEAGVAGDCELLI